MSEHQSQRLSIMLLALFILIYAYGFTHLTFLRFDAFEARALDLGNFDQAIWNTAHGRWFHLTNQPGIVNRLSLHVEPILVPISALYWIVSSPKTLLLLQSVVVALGAIPIYLLAKAELESPWLALIFGLAFLLHPSIQAANWLEFHAVTLAPTFLLAAFVCLRNHRNRLFVLFAILAASCKEEIGLLVFMMGMYAFFFLYRRRFGLLTMTFSLSWALLAVFGIQQFFGAGNIHWGRYSYLGDSPLHIVQTLVVQPRVVLSQLASVGAFGYLLQIMAPVLLVSILAPEMLLLAMPSLALNLLADFPPMHQVDSLIYAAPIVPFVLISGVYGLKRLLALIQGGHIGASSHANQRGKFGRVMPHLIAILMLCSVVGNHIIFGYTPGSGNYLHLEVTEHHHNAQIILDQIPPDAKVSAQDRLNPHVSQRETVYIYPRVEDPVTGDADTILIDATGPSFPLHPNDLYQQIQEWRQKGFGIAAGQDGYLLLRRDAPSDNVPPEFYSAWQVNQSEPLGDFYPVQINFGDILQLTGVHVGTDRYGELVTEMTWQLLTEHQRDLTFYVAYLGPNGQPLHTSEFYPLPVSLWYPTSLWEVGDAPRATRNFQQENSVSTSDNNANTQPNVGRVTGLYRVRTLPWTLEQNRFALAIGVFYADSGPEWSGSLRLVAKQEKLDGSTPQVPLLEGKTLARIGGYEQQDGEWSPLSPPTPPTNRFEAQFGQAVQLEGVTLSTPRLAPSELLRVALSWQVIEPISRDYSVFVHVVSEEGTVIAQLDRQPADRVGIVPMTSWPVQKTIVDEMELEIPDSTPAGHYQLLTGLYYWEDGERLPVYGARAANDNALEIGWIEITD